MSTDRLMDIEIMVKVKVLAAQSCPTFCDPMEYSPRGSSVHGILQAEYWSGQPFSFPGDLPKYVVYIHDGILLSYKKKNKKKNKQKKHIFESVVMRKMNLELLVQNEVSQKDKHKQGIFIHIYGIQKDVTDEPICRAAMEMQTQRTDFWTQYMKEMVGQIERVE